MYSKLYHKCSKVIYQNCLIIDQKNVRSCDTVRSCDRQYYNSNSSRCESFKASKRAQTFKTFKTIFFINSWKNMRVGWCSQRTSLTWHPHGSLGVCWFIKMHPARKQRYHYQLPLSKQFHQAPAICSAT